MSHNLPFGSCIRERDRKRLTAGTGIMGTIGFIFDVIWALTFGLTLFAYYLVAGVLCCLIGIPFGLQSFKLAGLSLWPVGRRMMSIEVAQAARQSNAAEELAGYRQGRGFEDRRSRWRARSNRNRRAKPFCCRLSNTRAAQQR